MDTHSAIIKGLLQATHREMDALEALITNADRWNLPIQWTRLFCNLRGTTWKVAFSRLVFEVIEWIVDQVGRGIEQPYLSQEFTMTLYNDGELCPVSLQLMVPKLGALLLNPKTEWCEVEDAVTDWWADVEESGRLPQEYFDKRYGVTV